MTNQNGKQAAIVRLIVLVVLVVNQALVTIGWNPLPFSEEEIFEGVSSVATAVVAVWTWYRNNNITDEAEETDKIMRAKKRAKKKRKKDGGIA